MIIPLTGLVVSYFVALDAHAHTIAPSAAHNYTLTNLVR